MEMELGHNVLVTSFTGTSATPVELSNEKEDSENDECCDSGCGCHD